MVEVCTGPYSARPVIFPMGRAGKCKAIFPTGWAGKRKVIFPTGQAGKRKAIFSTGRHLRGDFSDGQANER